MSDAPIDERPVNEDGESLNKDGSVSKNQPAETLPEVSVIEEPVQPDPAPDPASFAGPDAVTDSSHITCPDCEVAATVSRWRYFQDAHRVVPLVGRTENTITTSGLPGFGVGAIDGSTTERLCCPACNALIPLEDLGLTVA